MAISSTSDPKKRTPAKATTVRKLKVKVLTIPVGQEYHEYVERVKARFNLLMLDQHLFTTNTPDLYEEFLKGIPEDAKQYHQCNACRTFINKFGGLVLINGTGVRIPAFWALEDTPAYYKPAITNVIKAIEKAKITGVFLTDEVKWGTQYTGGWEHFGIQPGKLKNVYWSSKILTPSQRSAELLEDYRMLCRNIEKYTLVTLGQAVAILDIPDALYRAEKVLGHAKWLHNLAKMRSKVKGTVRDDLTWHAVATAPAGFCHISTTMISTLLDDLQSGLYSFEEVKRRFDEKMHPLKYRTPTAPVKDQNITRAENLIDKLGLRPSLDRRFARIDELPLIWSPRSIITPMKIGKKAGTFDHLREKPKAALIDTTGHPITMTWARFQKEVLPNILKMEYRAVISTYGAIVAPVHPDAPIIFSYGSAFSHYTYPGATHPLDWGIRDSWVNVTGIVYQPTMWNADTAGRFDRAVYFLLKGCVDQGDPSLGLFLSFLKSELHPIQNTIKAHSDSQRMAGKEEASACGLRLSDNNEWKAQFRVTTQGSIGTYILDRWE